MRFNSRAYTICVTLGKAMHCIDGGNMWVYKEMGCYNKALFVLIALYKNKEHSSLTYFSHMGPCPPIMDLRALCNRSLPRCPDGARDGQHQHHGWAVAHFRLAVPTNQHESATSGAADVFPCRRHATRGGFKGKVWRAASPITCRLGPA